MPLFLWTVGICHCDEKQLSAHSSRLGSVTLGKSLWKPEEAKPVTSIVKSKRWWAGLGFSSQNPCCEAKGGHSHVYLQFQGSNKHAFLASVDTRHACGVQAYTLAKHPHTLICKRRSREQALAQAPLHKWYCSYSGWGGLSPTLGNPIQTISHKLTQPR